VGCKSGTGIWDMDVNANGDGDGFVDSRPDPTGFHRSCDAAWPINKISRRSNQSM